MFLSIENHKKSPNYQGFRGFFIFIFFTFLAKLLFQLLVGGGVNSNIVTVNASVHLYLVLHISKQDGDSLAICICNKMGV
jgi:hypothetical protein